MEESMHVIFDKSNPSSIEKVVVDDDAVEDVQEELSKDKQEDAPQENQKDK